MTGAESPTSLATVSLRRRITLTTFAVFAVVLVATGVIAYASFTVISNRSVATVLNSQADLARELAARHTPPAELVALLETRSVSALLELDDGRTFGSLKPRVAADTAVTTRHVRLTEADGVLRGARLTLAVDNRPLLAARARLARVLTIVAAVALIAIAMVVPIVVRRALRPLDTMTDTARHIAGGSRGQRFRPPSQNTELGRTAAAFDEMIDALEGAERRALASEERMRRFVADAAHELRTPIAGISAAAEAVLQQPRDADPAVRERLLRVLGGEAVRAGRLVDDLLDLARIDSGLSLHPEPTDLLALVDAQAQRARLTHPVVPVTVTGHPVTVNVDAARIGQVLANLLNNACDVTSRGGTVRATVTTSPNGALAIVHDGGSGVAPPDRERIFGRLVRLDGSAEPGPGAGLGLTIARGIARAHGGDVTCEQPPSGTSGAVFVLRLPC